MPASAPAGRLDADLLADVDRLLADADRLLATRYPGDPGTRQPVHTVYLPADQVGEDTTALWGEQATGLLTDAAPDAATAAEVTGLGPALDDEVYRRVRRKLAEQPVEDLRADFEDGYGARPDSEEDTAAGSTGALLASMLAAPNGPSFAGVRFKSFEPATRRRGLRTLDLVVGGLLTAGPVPNGFLVTLPKVTSVDQVDAMQLVCTQLEARYGLPAGRLRYEIQIETPQSVLGADGRATVAEMVHAAGARCVGLHYGTYDYSAACGIAAGYQSMEHPVADHAKAVMQVAVAGTPVRLSDGSTNVLPVGSLQDRRAAMHLHARLVSRSLERGYYQGWDMHPGHLATRYLATYTFFRAGLPAAVDRLRGYLSQRAGGVMDEPATAQALASFVVRGLHCGAFDETEVTARVGVPPTTLNALARRLPIPAGQPREDSL